MVRRPVKGDSKESVKYAAAGAVVRRHDGRVLVLRRGAEVRLPKGHIEPGEQHADAAVRETIEESGYCDIRIIADLGTMTVEFDREGERPRHVIRDEHYFLAYLMSDMVRPRSVYDSVFVTEWLTPDEAVAALTYEAEKEWTRRAAVALNRAGRLHCVPEEPPTRRFRGL